MNKDQLAEILEQHRKWLYDDGGERANLSGANLRDANLSGANLRDANLSGADLYGANLIDANLRGADLSDANLSGANLRDANLYGANLRGANLRDADLSGANLRGADLYGANLRDADLYGANLRGAKLWNCAGNRNEIKSILAIDTYPITYTAEYLQIGCQRHPIADWWEFDDAAIAAMDGKIALKFWREWKDTIRAIIEKSPATPAAAEAQEDAA